MKLLDVFEQYKAQYMDAVVLIKNGKFYLTYDNDALILNYICNYKRINGKVGFPENALQKVIDLLEENKISYVIASEDENLFENNNYYTFLKKANEGIIVDNMCDNLINMVKLKIMDDFDNYKKIKEFIGEL